MTEHAGDDVADAMPRRGSAARAPLPRARRAGIAPFVGRTLRRGDVAAKLAVGAGGVFRLWCWMLRIVSPLAVLVVLLNGLGVL